MYYMKVKVGWPACIKVKVQVGWLVCIKVKVVLFDFQGGSGFPDGL